MVLGFDVEISQHCFHEQAWLGPLRWLPRTRILVFRRRIWRVSLVPLWIDRDRIPTPFRLVPAFSASISRGGAAIFSAALGGTDVTRDDVRTQAFTQLSSVTASPHSSRAATQLIPPPLTIATSEALREKQVSPPPLGAVEKLMPMGGSPFPTGPPRSMGPLLRALSGAPLNRTRAPPADASPTTRRETPPMGHLGSPPRPAGVHHSTRRRDHRDSPPPDSVLSLSVRDLFASCELSREGDWRLSRTIPWIPLDGVPSRRTPLRPGPDPSKLPLGKRRLGLAPPVTRHPVARRSPLGGTALSPRPASGRSQPRLHLPPAVPGTLGPLQVSTTRWILQWQPRPVLVVRVLSDPLSLLITGQNGTTKFSSPAPTAGDAGPQLISNWIPRKLMMRCSS
ncbi:hypothetical protein ACOMHN_052944 [Nucella lapillus]